MFLSLLSPLQIISACCFGHRSIWYFVPGNASAPVSKAAAGQRNKRSQSVRRPHQNICTKSQYERKRVLPNCCRHSPAGWRRYCPPSSPQGCCLLRCPLLSSSGSDWVFFPSSLRSDEALSFLSRGPAPIWVRLRACESPGRSDPH